MQARSFAKGAYSPVNMGVGALIGIPGLPGIPKLGPSIQAPPTTMVTEEQIARRKREHASRELDTFIKAKDFADEHFVQEGVSKIVAGNIDSAAVLSQGREMMGGVTKITVAEVRSDDGWSLLKGDRNDLKPNQLRNSTYLYSDDPSQPVVVSRQSFRRDGSQVLGEPDTVKVDPKGLTVEMDVKAIQPVDGPIVTPTQSIREQRRAISIRTAVVASGREFISIDETEDDERSGSVGEAQGFHITDNVGSGLVGGVKRLATSDKYSEVRSFGEANLNEQGELQELSIIRRKATPNPKLLQFDPEDTAVKYEMRTLDDGVRLYEVFTKDDDDNEIREQVVEVGGSLTYIGDTDSKIGLHHTNADLPADIESEQKSASADIEETEFDTGPAPRAEEAKTQTFPLTGEFEVKALSCPQCGAGGSAGECGYCGSELVLVPSETSGTPELLSQANLQGMLAG